MVDDEGSGSRIDLGENVLIRKFYTGANCTEVQTWVHAELRFSSNIIYFTSENYVE